MKEKWLRGPCRSYFSGDTIGITDGKYTEKIFKSNKSCKKSSILILSVENTDYRHKGR